MGVRLGGDSAKLDAETEILNLSEGHKKILAQVAGHAESVRDGGLDAIVGEVPYNTPSKLNDAVVNIYYEIGNSTKLLDAKSAKDVIPALPKIDLTKLMEVPLVGYKLRIVETACPPGSLKDPFTQVDGNDNLPNCYVHYIENANKETKRKLGLMSRHLMQSPQHMRLLMGEGGFCPLIASVLSLTPNFCQKWTNVMVSLPPFVKISDAVVDIEKELYEEPNEEGDVASSNSTSTDQPSPKRGTSANDTAVGAPAVPPMKPSLLQTAGSSEESQDVANEGVANKQDDSANSSETQVVAVDPSLQELEQRVEAVQFKIWMKKLWNFSAVSPMRREANELLENWHNEPVHKWRYAAGLLEYLTSVGSLFAYAQAQG